MRYVLIILTVLAWLAGAAQAQTKIATINLRRVFDGYWKTKAASADLRGRTEEYDLDFKKLLEQYQKANEAYRQLVAKTSEPGVTADEKKKLENAARAKVGEVREMETELNQFLQHSRTMLNEKQQRLRVKILAEIGVVVAAKAGAGSFDLVLDTSGETANNTPTVAYSNGKNDLTEAVIEELNASAPADLLKPEPATKTETPPKPDATPKK